MSHCDYGMSLLINDPPFAAIIMAAARKADTDNLRKLEQCWPGIVQELRERYNAPGGLLEGEA